MKNPHHKGGFIKILGLVFIILFIGAGIFMLTSESFEKEPPKIIPQAQSWNLKNYFAIQVSDNSGIKNFQVAFIDESGTKIPLEEIFYQDSACLEGEAFMPLGTNPKKPTSKEFCIGIKAPKEIKNNIAKLHLEVSATDTSHWNFFGGNTTTQSLNLEIDTKKPQVAVISNSYKITQGGSALVIFKAFDEHLKSVRVSNGENYFIALPFYEKDYYIALLAWPKDNAEFNATIQATDEAGNTSVVPINYYRVAKKYKSSSIQLTDNFIEGKITSLTEEIGERSLDSFADKLSLFKYINEEVRDYSVRRIMEVASNFDREVVIEDFHLKPFSPLRNGAVMASFGDHRTFIYQGKAVSESNHMGLDLASIKQAPILLSNTGVVILDEFVGIDGNAVIVYHGLGLSSLYAHLTQSAVSVGEEVAAGDSLGVTGSTGLALGDHLHFGILVQGHEVWTSEWMDSKWIADNITKVITEAKNTINQNH